MNLNIRQAAAELNISESALRRLVDGGAMPHHRFGCAIRITPEDMREFLDKTKVVKGEKAKREVRPRFVPPHKIRNVF